MMMTGAGAAVPYSNTIYLTESQQVVPVLAALWWWRLRRGYISSWSRTLSNVCGAAEEEEHQEMVTWSQLTRTQWERRRQLQRQRTRRYR